MEIYIVRHGESLSNIGESDDLDSNLSPIGERQAECLGQYLKDIKFDKIYSSHLTRAVQTAAAIAKYQPDMPEIIVVPAFSETGTPENYEAKTELHKTFYSNIKYTTTKIGKDSGGDIVRLEAALDKYVNIPAYTNTAEVENRDGFEKKNNPQRILISAHGAANAVLLSCMINFRFDINMNVVQHNTCVNKLELFLYNEIPRVRFLRYNDVTHLPDELRAEGQF